VLIVHCGNGKSSQAPCAETIKARRQPPRTGGMIT
jgi:hypothetical protein